MGGSVRRSDTNPHDSSLRFYSKIPGQGLSLTRAFGDLSFVTSGLTYFPEITEREMDGTEGWIVLGSDGLWDQLDCAEVFERVREQGVAAVGGLVARAREMWTMCCDCADDVTAVVVALNK
jgi:serine/threonine protein phosphatase PrpC